MYYIFIFSFVLLLIAEIISIIKGNRYVKSLNGCLNDSKISIIIPARNEEKTIGDTLRSIENQADHNFELVIIVDRCEDLTLDIVEEFAESADFPVQIIINELTPPIGNNPKVFLLKSGIEAAAGELFLFTDADCIVPSDWLLQYRKMFSQKDTGLVPGFLSVKSDRSLLTNFQNFDHIYRSFYTAACTGAGIPTGGFGNNLAVSRECYDSFGGYDGLPKSVTEDAVMVSSVGKSQFYKVRALSSRSASVQTHAQTGLNNFLKQSVRWTSGAVYAPDIKSRLFYIILMFVLTFVHMVFPFSLLSSPALIIPVIGYLYLFTSALAAGIFMNANIKYWIYLIPSIFLFFIFYQITFVITLFRPHII
ncbi:MAG: glycosyltransferase, partial [Spirochaetales bacterium]|nr:glycosyltransferase [Spirochaetales bacterium]